MPLFHNLKVSKKGPDAEIRGELDAELVRRHEEDVLESWRRDFEAPGFRKGHVPKEIFLARVNAGAALEEAAELALEEAYVEILAEAAIKTIGGPTASFTKLAAGNPVEFKIEAVLVPEVKLPNYKKIAASASRAQIAPAVTEEEVQKVIDELRGLRKVEGVANLPELTDDYVKTIGKFENVADFRAKLRENMKKEKEAEVKQKKREAIAGRLIEATKLEISPRLVAEEAAASFARLTGELKSANVPFEEYLKRAGQTEETLAKEHRDSAERQFKTRFILEAIAEKENIIPTDEEIQTEMGTLLARYPGLDHEHARLYVQNRLRNEKVLAFLESQNSL